MKQNWRFRKIWISYFIVKVFFLLFAFLIFARLTSLGDTSTYLNAPLNFTPAIFYSSTEMMLFFGSLFKRIFFFDIVASIPFMLLSFYGVYYAIDRLNLYAYQKLVFLIVSMPNFGIWTSVLSKEAVGCFFSSVIGVLIVRQINGDYRYRAIDFLAIYLCLVFKPQYLFFIIQVLIFLRICKLLKSKVYLVGVVGLLILSSNICVLYFFRETIDILVQGMYVHFTYNDPDLALSTRSPDAWFQPYGVFKEAPYGMFIAFFGPTIDEMLSKVTHFVSGVESVIILSIYVVMLSPRVLYLIKAKVINLKITFTFLILFLGILFVHYPFGYLNPGSAIRYRENFYMLFSLMMLYLFDYKHVTDYVVSSTRRRPNSV